MTHIEKLKAYYRGAKALKIAADSDIIHPVKQLSAYEGMVTAMVADMERHLHLHGELPTEEYATMRIVMGLGGV